MQGEVEAKLKPSPTELGSLSKLIVLAARAGFNASALGNFKKTCEEIDHHIRNGVCRALHLDPENAWFCTHGEDGEPVELWQEIRAWLEELVDTEQRDFGKVCFNHYSGEFRCAKIIQ